MQLLQEPNSSCFRHQPLSEILLLLRSSQIKVLLFLKAIPIAIAPSSQNPFQQRSRNLMVMFAFIPAQIASAPCKEWKLTSTNRFQFTTRFLPAKKCRNASEKTSVSLFKGICRMGTDEQYCPQGQCFLYKID